MGFGRVGDLQKFGVFEGLEEVEGSRGVETLGCSGKGGLGCLKVWTGSEVLEGFGMFGGGAEFGRSGIRGVWGRRLGCLRVRCLEV